MHVHETVRFYFDSLDAAADALVLLLEDARATRDKYEFGGLTAGEIFSNGLMIQGKIYRVAKILEQVPGALRHDE